MGVQKEAERYVEGSPVCSRVRSDGGRRLRSDLLRYNASDFSAGFGFDRCWQRHADAPLGFRGGLPPGRIAGRRS
eukprot:5853589-Pleurochrysis_carterae.AAC.1